MGGSLHPPNPGTLRDAREAPGELIPRVPVVGTHPGPAVVGSGQEETLIEGRLGQGDDGGEGLGSGDVRGDAAGLLCADADLLGIGVAELRADDLKFLPPVDVLHHPVGPHIDHHGIVR